MPSIFSSLVYILLLVKLISSTALSTIYLYNADSSAEIIERDPYRFNWFIKRTIKSDYSVIYQSIRQGQYPYNNLQYIASFSKKSQYNLVALSRGFTCALLSGNAEFLVVRFQSSRNQIVLDLFQTGLMTSAQFATVKTYEVAERCHALRLDGVLYYFKQNSSFPYQSRFVIKKNLPSPLWINPVFSQDFSFVVGDEGLYRLNMTIGTSYLNFSEPYSCVLPTTFYPNKKIWVKSFASFKIIVLSWVDTTTPNIKNYSIKAFRFTNEADCGIYLVGSVQGQYYDKLGNVPPQISFSWSLKTFVIYGKYNSTAFFAQGRTYFPNQNYLIQFKLPAWITDTQSAVSVSDVFLYARNIANKTGVIPTTKQHGAYFITANHLTTYFDTTALSDTEINNWKKSKIYDSLCGNLCVLRQHEDWNILKLQGPCYNPSFTLFQENEMSINQLPSTSEIRGSVQKIYDQSGNGRWFVWSQATDIYLSKINIFYSIYINATNDVYKKIKVDYSLNINYELKAVSKNNKCALIYDSRFYQLRTFNFDSTNSSQLVLSIDTISASLYSGIDLNYQYNQFEVSDDCKGIRINNKIMHKHSDNVFYADTFPTELSTLSTSLFSADFSLLVAYNGIYYYTSKVGVTAGFYTLDRKDIFYQLKKLWTFGNNYIVFSNQQSGYSLSPRWKIQFYSIQNSVSTKIGQFQGDALSWEQLSIVVGPRLTKIIFMGTIVINPQTKRVFYFAKTVDWKNKIIKDIILPSEITNSYSYLAISDDFLYVSKQATNITNRMHSAYSIIGGNLVQIFNQSFPYPQTYCYAKSIIIPDRNKHPRLILAHKFGSFTLMRNFRTNVPKILQLTSTQKINFTKPVGFASFKRQSYPNFGKWLYTTNLGTTLNYIEYDTTLTNKKKIITKASLTENNIIVATSPDFDCVITQGLNLFKISSYSSKIYDPISLKTTVLASDDKNLAEVYLASITDGQIQVGNNCQAFRVNNSVYWMNYLGEYVKLKIVSALVSPVFDKSLNFAYSAGKIYKFKVSDSYPVLNVTGLKNTVEIHASTDLKRLIILSYQPRNGTSYDVVIKIYDFDGFWRFLALPASISSFTTTQNRPEINFSPSFDTIGIQYLGGQSSAIKPVIIFAKINFQTVTISMYQIPNQFIQNGVTPNILTYENHIYVENTVNGIINEFLYKIDKINLRIVKVERLTISADQFQKNKNVNLFQESGNLVALYEIEPAFTTVVVVKRIMSNSGIQNTLTGNETSQSGMLTQNGELFTCIAGCSLCENLATCQVCMIGYTLDINSRCSRCGSLCTSCTDLAATTCLTCFNGHYLNAGTCLKCHDSCITCISFGQTGCTSCKVGFYVQNAAIGKNGVCLACMNNCVTCNKTGGNPLCGTCKLGYVYSPTLQTCVKCIAGCTNCKYDKIYQCEKCGNGFEPINNNASEISWCKKCPVYCKICSSGTCTECRNSFRLTNNTCVQLCKLPCNDCFVTDPTQCISCIGGFIMNGTACNPDLTCNAQKSCTYCVIGFNLVDGACYPCDGGPNCRTCENNNISRCASCIQGFYLTPTYTCLACNIIGCQSCDTEKTCAQCKIGYILSGANISSFECLKCHDSCATCFDFPTNCETCATGYISNGWNCISTDYIKLIIQLVGSFLQLTTLNYIEIEQAICNLIQKQRSQINLEELRSSSIVITATVNTHSAIQKSTLMATLQSAFTLNSTLAGFTIQKSSLTAETANNSTENNQTVFKSDNTDGNQSIILIIVLAVGIPIVLIIIVTICNCLYKKGYICRNKLPTKVQDIPMNELNQIQNKSQLESINK